MNVQLTKTFRVEAAHRNLHGAEPAQRLHGHSFRIVVVVEGEVDGAFGWLVDYGDIKRAFRPLWEQLDHHYLNEIEGMGDANLGDIAAWIRRRLAPALPALKDVRVAVAGDNAFRLVELAADPQHELPPRLRFTFEAAQRLPHLPPEHPCRRLHGHSYCLEIGARDLDRLRDRLGDPLRDIYDILDHRCLNDVADLNEATSERLCAWVWDRLAPHVDDLEAVVVQETDTARCIYHGR